MIEIASQITVGLPALGWQFANEAPESLTSALYTTALYTTALYTTALDTTALDTTC